MHAPRAPHQLRWTNEVNPTYPHNNNNGLIKITFNLFCLYLIFCCCRSSFCLLCFQSAGSNFAHVSLRMQHRMLKLCMYVAYAWCAPCQSGCCNLRACICSMFLSWFFFHRAPWNRYIYIYRLLSSLFDQVLDVKKIIWIRKWFGGFTRSNQYYWPLEALVFLYIIDAIMMCCVQITDIRIRLAFRTCIHSFLILIQSDHQRIPFVVRSSRNHYYCVLKGELFIFMETKYCGSKRKLNASVLP